MKDKIPDKDVKQTNRQAQWTQQACAFVQCSKSAQFIQYMHIFCQIWVKMYA